MVCTQFRKWNIPRAARSSNTVHRCKIGTCATCLESQDSNISVKNAAPTPSLRTRSDLASSTRYARRPALRHRERHRPHDFGLIHSIFHYCDPRVRLRHDVKRLFAFDDIILPDQQPDAVGLARLAVDARIVKVGRRIAVPILEINAAIHFLNLVRPHDEVAS